jgi:hypothetical protein
VRDDNEGFCEYGAKYDEGSREYIKVGWFAIFLLALCITGIAQAQTRVTPCSATTANNELCITGPAVTTGTNGEALQGVTYDVERRLGSGSYSTIATGLTSIQLYDKNLAPGTYTYRVYANCTNVGCVKSAASNAASGNATAVPIQPNAPTLIIVASISADRPPVYRIIQSVTLRPGEVVFAAPASMRSVFAAR